MATRALTKPVGVEGFVGITGTAPRGGSIAITAITPRISLYVKIGENPDTKIPPSTVLPVNLRFEAGDDFRAMATDDMVVTYTLTLDP
jgi:hypothetical protein